jgi:CheY-like chemotaxis protein
MVLAGKRVLVADDEFLIRWALTEALKKDGYEVRAVEDGEQALDAFERHDFDLIVTDLMMPRLDGWEVLRRIKESNPNVKVIIVTAHGASETETTARARGAYGYVEKPDILDKVVRTGRVSRKVAHT